MENNFIEVYSGVMSTTLSESLIGLFYKGGCENIDNSGTPTFSQININKNYPEYVSQLSYCVIPVLRKYKEKYSNFSRWFPQKIFLEEFRIKRYNGGSGDRFDLHVDVDNHETSRRLLAFLFYLNDNFEGGETEFPYHDKIIKPVSGSVLVFPPTWQYPHSGLPVKKGKKYILSTYLHYY